MHLKFRPRSPLSQCSYRKTTYTGVGLLRCLSSFPKVERTTPRPHSEKLRVREKIQFPSDKGFLLRPCERSPECMTTLYLLSTAVAVLGLV